MRMRIVAGALCAITLIGCSWTFQEHAAAPRCTDSKALAGADVLFVTLNAVAVIAVAGDAYDVPNKTAVIGAGIGGAAVFAASAITGIVWSGRCHKASQEGQQWTDPESDLKKFEREHPVDAGADAFDAATIIDGGV